jgi:hypothetical protein
MPYTPKQKRYLLSKGSPLSEGQKDKMKKELHENPSLGHAKKHKSSKHDGRPWDNR